MIARIWRGWTKSSDSEEYVEYVLRTGAKEYRETPGNRGAYVLRRPQGDRTEFLTLSFWDSLEAVKKFAGEDVNRAVFYPEDDRFLVDRERTVSHFELIDATEREPGNPRRVGPESGPSRHRMRRPSPPRSGRSRSSHASNPPGSRRRT